MRRENWRQQIWRRLRYTVSSLPHTSVAVRLPVSLDSLRLQVGVGEVKSPPLSVKTRFQST